MMQKNVNPTNIENEAKSDVGISTLGNVVTRLEPDLQTTSRHTTFFQRSLNVIKTSLKPIGQLIGMDFYIDQ